MKIIISGDGEVGFYLAKLLEREFQDIALIDTQKEKLDAVEKELGIATILGNCTSYKVLKEAGIQDADLFIAVTSNETTNITACIIGKKLGAKFTIARISSTEFLIDKTSFNFREVGIDNLVSPESLAAREIKNILELPALNENITLNDGELCILGLNIEENPLLVNKTIEETIQQGCNNSFKISVIHRENKTIFPKGNTILKKQDILYFTATEKGKNKVLEYAGKNPLQINNILIIGGSRTGKFAALKLSKNYHVKIIEKYLDKCYSLAMEIPRVQIVCGDGTNVKLLEEEGIAGYDAIIAVTGNSEANIFSCLIAKEAGVKKNIAMVENIGLFDYSQKMGIDTLINKKLAAANFIFKSIHRRGILSHLYGVDAEIHEFMVTKRSRALHHMVREIEFPENAIIGGIIRNNNGYIANDDLQLRENDKVYVLSLPQNNKNVSKFF